MCFGSDGASAMIGCNNGVAAQLKRKNPTMISVHCICHREALACEDAVDEIDYLKATFFPLIEFGRFFSNSGKRTAEFEAMQKQEGFIPLKLGKSSFIRWLSYEAVTKVIFQRHIPLLKYLNLAGISDPTACGLSKPMSNSTFLYMLLTLRDVLLSLSTMSKIFQSTNADMKVRNSIFPSIINTIEDQIENKGEQVLKFPLIIETLSEKRIEIVVQFSMTGFVRDIWSL
eukprot:Pompholyxophrys_punicea_v1_NODE_581_length_1653_cov_12.396120.p1 type:complete len:229 gc:universal NODE_581_length_1653_cov_12.396120:869-1555(+)